MKVKLKTPDHILVGLTRRELVIISNCLNEACHGLLMDRFVPAHDELVVMLDTARDIAVKNDFYKLKPAIA